MTTANTPTKPDSSPSLRALVDKGQFILAPGVFDLMSTLMANQYPLTAVYASGYWTMASALGEPDVGIGTYRDFESRYRQIVEKSRAPVIADADTGFGGMLNVAYTVRGFERVGISAIQIEDQEFPKKCGHTPHKRIVPTEDMVTRLKIAVDTRSSREMLVIARTDARQSEGLDGALRRAEAYAEAGADILFVEAPQSLEEMRTIGERFDLPLMANIAHGGSTPILGQAELEALGYQVAIYPAAAPLVMLKAMNDVYRRFAETRTPMAADDAALYNFKQFCSDIGFDDVYAFETKWGREYPDV